MSEKFNAQYVKESVDLFFNKAIIDHSSNASQHIFNQDNEHTQLKNFSVSHHASVSIPKFLSVFPFARSHEAVAAQVLEIIENDSRFVEYFSSYYSKTQFQIEKAVLYLLILSLVKVGQIKDGASEAARSKQAKLEKKFAAEVDKGRVRLECAGLGEKYVENTYLVPVCRELLTVFKYTALCEYIDDLAKASKLSVLRRCVKENAAVEAVAPRQRLQADSKACLIDSDRKRAQENMLQVGALSKNTETPQQVATPMRVRKNSKDRVTPKKSDKQALARSEESGKDRKALFFDNFIKDSRSDGKRPQISEFGSRSKDEVAEPRRSKAIQKMASQLSLIPKAKQGKTRVIKSSYTDKYVTKRKQTADQYVINLHNVNENFNKLYSDVMTRNSYGEGDCLKDLHSSELSKPMDIEEHELGLPFFFDENQQSIQFADLCNEIQAAKTPVKGLLGKFNSA